MQNRIVRKVSLLSLAAFSAVLLRAQAPVGSINGIVHDQSGLVMAGVNVTITNKATGAVRQMTTSTDGIFSASSLPSADYALRAEATGFRPLDVTATVRVGNATEVDLVMQVGTETETVNVEAEAAQINYDSHEISGVITHAAIDNLPLNGRSFLQLSALEPGVTVQANNVSQFNKQFDVTILGASSANNQVRITVDGATVQDAITGGTQQNFSQEVIQEFQVSSTNFDLSTGVGAGGAINLVTRSGGNDFHGSGFFYFRDHNLSAFPFLQRGYLNEPSNPFFQRKQEGYSVGGPIKKDKVFFFSSLEHIDQTTLYPSIPSDQTHFAAYNNFQSGPYHANELTERFDWRINNSNNAYLRYSHDGNNSFGSPGFGDQPSGWTNNTNWADSGVVSLISALTPATSNEFRYSYTFWSNQNAVPTASQCPAPCLGFGYTGNPNSDGPMITVLGVNDFSVGEAATAPQSRLVRRHILADNVSSQKGTHSLKFGGYWEYQKGTGSWAYSNPAALELYSPGQVTAYNATHPLAPLQLPSSFNTLQDLLRLPVSEFSIGIGDPTQPPLYKRGDADHDSLFHFYAEDTWKFKPRLTINYGLAWSYESNALNHDLTKSSYLAPIFGANGLGPEMHEYKNFSPMLGFAWNVGKDNKTVIRGGSAIYYDTWNIELRLIERVILAPGGIGRIPLPDSAFFGFIAPINGFANLPQPIQLGPNGQPLCGLPICSLSSQPTNFNGIEFENLLPAFITGATKIVNSGAAQNVDLFKTGQGLIPQNFRLPYSEHASIGIQRELRPDLVLSADFVFRQYMHQVIENPDLNHYNSPSPVIPTCVPGSGQALKLPGQPGYVNCSAGPIEALIDGGRSHYEGLLMKLSKRLSHNFAGTLSYAYASAVGYNGLADNNNWFASYGPQMGHQTLTGAIVVGLPLGIQLSGITYFNSASPFQPFIVGPAFFGEFGGGVFNTAGESPFPGFPLPGGGFNQFNVSKNKQDLINLVNQFNATYAGKVNPYGNVIPAINLPSNFQFPRSFNSQDVRVTKVFNLHGERVKLSIIGECFNVFNIANNTLYNDSLGVGTASNNYNNFGQATLRESNTFGTGGPRAFQLAGRINF